MRGHVLGIWVTPQKKHGGECLWTGFQWNSHDCPLNRSAILIHGSTILMEKGFEMMNWTSFRRLWNIPDLIRVIFYIFLFLVTRYRAFHFRHLQDIHTRIREGNRKEKKSTKRINGKADCGLLNSIRLEISSACACWLENKDHDRDRRRPVPPLTFKKEWQSEIFGFQPHDEKRERGDCQYQGVHGMVSVVFITNCQCQDESEPTG